MTFIILYDYQQQNQHFLLYYQQPNQYMQGQSKRKPHNDFNFKLKQDITLKISSDFDSGNLESAEITYNPSQTQDTPLVNAILTPAIQPFNPNYSSKPSTKTFFHFSIKSTQQIIFHPVIRRMTILSYVQNSFNEYYRICVGKKPNPYVEPIYEKIKPEYMKVQKEGQEYVLEYQYLVPANQTLYFAYHYPYSCQKLRSFLHDVDEIIKMRNDSSDFIHKNRYLYFRNELLIESVESRPVNLLTFTQIDRDKICQQSELQKNQEKQADTQPKIKTDQVLLALPRQPRISRTLFPFFDLQDRPYKFSKPIIMITCRVHPGETSASFALQGLINKLIYSDSPEIEFLLRSFVFLIVPMVNPDGVYNGTYRMDAQGHNLNRFYNSCSSHKQPSIFAIQTLMNFYSEEIHFFLDIHSHPQLKGSFIYGNAYSSIYDQTQSQSFAKLLSYNSECFNYQSSTFTEKNMASKDTNELMTKDGSARVYAFKKILNNIHCYTIQMGYHGAPIKKDITPVHPELLSFKSEYRRTERNFYDIDYEEHGAAVLKTIAQVYLQSYSFYESITATISNSKNEYPLGILREELGKQINDKEQRFKMMDGGLNKKLKTVNLTITNNFYSKIFKKYPHFAQNYKEYLQLVANPTKNRKTIDCISDLDRGGLRKNYQSETLSMAAPRKSNTTTSHHQKISKQSKYSEDLQALFAQEPNIAHKISAARQITRVLKHKINITPFQFQMPPEKKKMKNNNLNKMMLNFDPLPKIATKRPIKILSDRHKALRQRRITSSLNKNNDLKIDEQEKSYQKMTIDSKLYDILDCEAQINCENYKEFHDEQMKIPIKQNTESEVEYEEYLSEQEEIPFDHRIDDMSFLHRGKMYRKNEKTSKQLFEKDGHFNTKHYKILRNYHTEKVAGSELDIKSHERSLSLKRNPDKKFSVGTEARNFLPKLQIKSDKIRNKYEVQLKMQQKYDKQFKVGIGETWKKNRKKSVEQFHI